MTNNKKNSARGSKPVKSPVATRTARSPQRRRTTPSSKTSNIGLIAGLTVLGLLVGGGIAAGTLLAINPLDGESGNTVSADTYIKKTELTNNGLYKTTGSGNSLVISKDVSDDYIEKSTVDSDYTLNTEISKKSILKSRLTTGGLYEATGTGDALDVGNNVRSSYTLTSDITKTYIPKSDILETGLYESTGSGETRTVRDVRNDYNLKTESILKSTLTEGHLYKATGTGNVLDLGADVSSLYTLNADISTTHLPKTGFTHEHLYKATATDTSNKNTITTTDVTETYVKKPTDEDQTFTFKFDTKSEITLNLDATSSKDDQTIIDPISSSNTSLSDDPAAAQSLSEIKLKVGETKTLYLTSNQQKGKTAPFITKKFFIGVKFTIKLVDNKGKYEISTPSVISDTLQSDVVKFRRTSATGDFNLIWNDLPRTEPNRLVTGSTTASLDPIISSTVRNSITIGDTDYFAAETVSNNLNDLYTITKEDVNESGALIGLGQGTNSIVKGNYKLYGSEGHSIDSLELTRISSATPKKFYLVAPLLPAASATLTGSGPGTVVILTLSISKTGEILTGEIEGDIRRRTVTNITTYGDFSSKTTGWNVVDQTDPVETLVLTTTQRTLTREFLDYLFVQNSIT